MNTDRMLAIAAFTVLFGFLGILVWFVPRLDLGMVVLITLVMTFYDLFFHRSRL